MGRFLLVAVWGFAVFTETSAAETWNVVKQSSCPTGTKRLSDEDICKSSAKYPFEGNGCPNSHWPSGVCFIFRSKAYFSKCDASRGRPQAGYDLVCVTDAPAPAPAPAPKTTSPPTGQT